MFYLLLFIFLITLRKVCAGRNLGRSEPKGEGERTRRRKQGPWRNAKRCNIAPHSSLCEVLFTATNRPLSHLEDTGPRSLLLLSFWKWTFSPSTQPCSNSSVTNILLGLSQNSATAVEKGSGSQNYKLFLELHIILLFLRREGSFQIMCSDE